MKSKQFGLHNVNLKLKIVKKKKYVCTNKGTTFTRDNNHLLQHTASSKHTCHTDKTKSHQPHDFGNVIYA